MDKERSQLGFDWNSLSAQERATIDGFIQGWLNLSTEKGTSILGYSAQAEDEECEYKPSFRQSLTSTDYLSEQIHSDVSPHKISVTLGADQIRKMTLTAMLFRTL